MAGWGGWLIFLLMGALLFLAPLVRGGNRAVAMAGLLALALVVLAALAALALQGRRGAGAAPALADGLAPLARWQWLALAVLVASPLWLGVLQLVPISAAWWGSLAGRQAYLDALPALGLAVPGALPLSLNPAATWASVWVGVPMVAALLAALRLPRVLLDRLLLVLLGAGLVQVLLGVAQFASGPNSALYFGLPGSGFIGSFANRNHLADFLAMLLPVWLYVWMKRQQRGGERHHGNGRLAAVARGPGMLLLGFSFVVVLLSTQSRGGVLAAALVLLLCGLLYFFTLRGQLKAWQQWLLGGALVAFVALAAASVDLQAILSRVEAQRLQEDADLRRTLAQATWTAAGAFWPWGSGLGTFESVFPRFAPAVALQGFVNHAHNDYAQLAMEAGAAGVLLALLVLALVLWQLVALVRAARRALRLTGELALRVFAGLGCLALLLHSWVEYNLHIPALAITASFLLGVFLRPLPAGGAPAGAAPRVRR